MTGRLLTARVVAEHLGLTPETVLGYVRQGKLPAFRLPSGQIRVSEDQLDRWLAERAEAERLADQEPTRLAHRSRWETDERDYAEILLNDPCSYCGRRTREIDHITPRARGGEHSWMNLTGACRPCNSAKSARHLLLFLIGWTATA